MNKLKRLWSNLQSSFWLTPALIVFFSIVLAGLLIDASTHYDTLWLARWPRLFGAGADGARGMMSTIAGSMISVVGVTFSMILVVLTLASSQYTSRILWNFMRSRFTQVVFGVFTGTFTYSLIVLRTIRSGAEGTYVPSLAVFFGLVLAIGGVFTLMLFVHNIASSIQAASIIAAASQATTATIDRLFPERLGEEPDASDTTPALPPQQGQIWYTIPAPESGYIQSVDNDALLHVAREQHAIIRMEQSIGGFVVQHLALVSLALETPPTPEVISTIQAAYSIHRHRTVEQDFSFGIRQVVDIALKALSPGINDTTTAVMCVDYLTAILARLSSRKLPAVYRYEGQNLRVIAMAPTYASMVAESFDQIRNNAKGNIAVISRLLDALALLAEVTSDPSRKRVLREHLYRISELIEHTIVFSCDRDQIDKQLARVRVALDTASTEPG